MSPKEWAAKLNEVLPEPLFEEFTRFVDEGDISGLYEEMAEIDATRHPNNYTLVEYEVEYDLNYTGGSYSGVGSFVRLMAASDGHVPIVFRKQTGHDAVHIIHAATVEEKYEDCE